MNGTVAAAGRRGHAPAERRRGVLLALAGIALYCAMDAAMKALTIRHGAVGAVFWRNALALAALAPVGAVLLARRRWRWPAPAVARLHALRGAVAAAMTVLFFWALARLPMAEAIAISFVSPLIAHYLAWRLLGEPLGRGSVEGTVLGLMGLALIIAPRLGGAPGETALLPVLAVLGSAALFAWNLILARRQALAAGPFEVALSQAGVMAVVLAPVLLAAAVAGGEGPVVPGAADLTLLATAAAFATGALMLLAKAYALAEAQVLIPTEYSALPWAALLGWLVFDEALAATTVTGAGLIALGVWRAARG